LYIQTKESDYLACEFCSLYNKQNGDFTYQGVLLHKWSRFSSHSHSPLVCVLPITNIATRRNFEILSS